MKHVRVILAIIVVNIFAILLVSILMEYANLSERFQQVDNNVNIALTSALDAVTQSEEMFSDDYNSIILSNATVGVSPASASMLVFDRTTNNFYQANPYVLSMVEKFWGTAHPTQAQYETYNNSLSSSHPLGRTAAIYTYLYGDVGSSYSDSNLTWANRSKLTAKRYNDLSIGTSRSVKNTEFEEYVKGIGTRLETVGYVKKQDNGYFNIVAYQYPVIANMGLDISGLESGDVAKGAFITGTGSAIMTDNFCSSAHVGKYTGGVQSLYYLTPNSLGLTYVPTTELKNVFKTNLDTLVRLQSVGVRNTGSNISLTSLDLASSTGCIESNVYDTASGSTTAATHTVATGADIVNDGLAEYDLSTVQVRVDYNLVNLYDPAYKNTVARIYGSESIDAYSGNAKGFTNQSNAFAGTVTALKNSETNRFFRATNGYTGTVDNNSTFSTQADKDKVAGQRVVARVSVRLKVHVPYQSGIIQWGAYMFRDPSQYKSNHFSVKLWDATNGTTATSDPDGVYYVYTTYIAAKR